MTAYPLNERTEWRHWVVPQKMYTQPIHRWFIFPHSFTGELVHALIEEWGLGAEDHVLDPFVGAGTTLLAARENGVPATGYDLSPLAILATQVKVAHYDVDRLKELWKALCYKIDPAHWNGVEKVYPDLVHKALPGKLLGAFDAIARNIASLDATHQEQDFFKLALLSTLPQYSRAVATGGWLKWVDKRNRSSSLFATFSKQANFMFEDLDSVYLPRGTFWRVQQEDARSLPDENFSYSAIITSPPYPNRHDYTRVFGVELMFGFLDWEQTRCLRYQSFHSHPEAHPVRPKSNGYTPPARLTKVIQQLQKTKADSRVIRMIKGYFLDLYLVLCEARRVCKHGARVAFVVGNVQYRGLPIPVDEFTAEIGEMAGLTCDQLLIARFRGNSAQQMAEYGRKPSRESVVVFSVP